MSGDVCYRVSREFNIIKVRWFDFHYPENYWLTDDEFDTEDEAERWLAAALLESVNTTNINDKPQYVARILIEVLKRIQSS